jgi:hypothetical protein
MNRYFDLIRAGYLPEQIISCSVERCPCKNTGDPQKHCKFPTIPLPLQPIIESTKNEIFDPCDLSSNINSNGGRSTATTADDTTNE